MYTIDTSIYLLTSDPRLDFYNDTEIITRIIAKLKSSLHVKHALASIQKFRQTYNVWISAYSGNQNLDTYDDIVRFVKESKGAARLL